MKKPKRQPRPKRYTLLDEMTASCTEPLPESWRMHQLTKMYQSLNQLEQGQNPTPDDWRICSDAVNLMETLITSGSFFHVKTDPETGHEWKEPIPGMWHGCDGGPVQITDANGLLMDAITALAMAGRRNKEGKTLRLDGAGIVAVRAILQDYSDLIEVLPARVIVRCHRLTEKRLHEILEGKKRPHDVEIVDL